MPHKGKLSVCSFSSYRESIAACLDELEAGSVFEKQSLVILKPNLINDSPFPITSAPSMIEAVILYVRRHFTGTIAIAEGCGDSHLTTHEVFQRLGYTDLALKHGIELVDLNEEPLRRLEDPRCRFFPEMYLPEIVFQGFLVSLPVLKRHSLATVTLSMKNMMGLAPPKYYQRGGSWKKSAFHANIHESILELNSYRKPDFSILDATVGMAEYHLGGATCDPPVQKIVAGHDPVAVDAEGAKLLGVDWSGVPHIRMAHGVLGMAH